MQPIFARIVKVDEETRTVTGRAAQEVVDRDNEIFDYDTSKPEFMKWSAEVHADTSGKSLGNVRSMHGNIAAGKLTNIDFNDVEKAIDVSAKIIDNNEWEKVLEGVHTGFSIGGRYARKWAQPINGKMVQRYTAVPSEISIVDRPCCPTAKFFEVHKRDGSFEKREFLAYMDKGGPGSGPHSTSQKGDDHGFQSNQHLKSANNAASSDGRQAHLEAAAAHSAAADAYKSGDKNAPKLSVAASKATEAVHSKYGKVAKLELSVDGVLSFAKGVVFSLNKDGGIGTLPATATTGIQDYDLEGEGRKKPGRGASKNRPKPRKDPYESDITPKPPWDRRSASERSTDTTDDTDDEECDVENAAKTAKAKPWSKQTENGDTSPPDTDTSVDDTSDDELEACKMNKADITAFDEPALEKFFVQHEEILKSGNLVKGVYDVATLGSLISQLKYMADNAAVERQVEGDNSTVPEDLRDAAANLLGVLSNMASEESKEIKDGTTAEDVMRDTQPTMTPGLYRSDIGELAKALRTSLFSIEGNDEKELAKAGARNSKKDMETLQKCHDSLCELGATCAAPSPHAQDGNDVKPPEVEKIMTNQVSKTDTVSAEGNKRGAAVTDPKLGPNSTNAVDAEDTSEQSQEKPNNNTKKGKARMDADAAKAKARADMDEDEDEDDDGDEDDVPAPKTKKAKKSEGFSMSNEDLAKMIATTVAATVASTMIEMNKADKSGGNERMIPRVAPNLMQVGKGGEVQKLDTETLRKSVTPVSSPNMAKWHKDDDTTTHAGTGMMVGDNDTATLIKAIHAAGPTFRLNPSEIPN